jgi:hypothetical protein
VAGKGSAGAGDGRSAKASSGDSQSFIWNGGGRRPGRRPSQLNY